MNTEIQSLVRESVRAVAIIVAVSIIMLGILAIVHDGELAQTIATQLEAAVQWGLPVIGVIVGILQISTAYIAGKNEGSGKSGNTTQRDS